MKKTPKKKSNSQKKLKYEVVELPSNNKDMEEYVIAHRDQINNQIINSIDYAITNKMGVVEVFCFKDSNFIVVLHRKDFRESLENVFDFSLNKQQFELCTKTKKLIEKFDKLGFVAQYKRKLK